MSAHLVLGIPFAGAAAHSLRPLVDVLTPEFEFVPLELPGRGRRVREPLLTDLDAMVDDLCERAQPLLDGRPFSLYGHSLGGWIAYGLLRRLEAEGRPLPRRLVVSAIRAPGSPPHRRTLHKLSDDELLTELQALGGMADELAGDRDVLEFLFPILRADLQAMELYEWTTTPCETPITALHGIQDDAPAASVGAWKNATRGEFQMHTFPGGHFFPLDHPDDVAATLRVQLR